MIYWNVYTGIWEVVDLRLISPDAHLAWMNELFSMPEAGVYDEYAERMGTMH